MDYKQLNLSLQNKQLEKWAICILCDQALLDLGLQSMVFTF